MADKHRAPVWMLKKAIQLKVGESITLISAGGNSARFLKLKIVSCDGKEREVIDIFWNEDD